jgi:hypothetical protein
VGCRRVRLLWECVVAMLGPIARGSHQVQRDMNRTNKFVWVFLSRLGSWIFRRWPSGEGLSRGLGLLRRVW